MKNGFGRKVALAVLPAAATWLIKCWFATCRIRVHGKEHLAEAEKRGTPIIGTCWHYSVLGIFIFYKEYPLVLMVSSSKDGDFLTRIAERLGFSVVRGSSNRKGAKAAIELIRELRKGKNAGLVADGSQGPARIAQSGTLLLAAKTSGTVLPMLLSANKYYAFNTWDRLIFPKPFAQIDLFYGDPLIIPAGLKVSESEEYRLILEKKLNNLYKQAWQLHGRDCH